MLPTLEVVPAHITQTVLEDDAEVEAHTAGQEDTRQSATREISQTKLLSNSAEATNSLPSIPSDLRTQSVVHPMCSHTWNDAVISPDTKNGTSGSEALVPCVPGTWYWWSDTSIPEI